MCRVDVDGRSLPANIGLVKIQNQIYENSNPIWSFLRSSSYTLKTGCHYTTFDAIYSKSIFYYACNAKKSNFYYI